MDTSQFDRVVAKMPELLTQLQSSPMLARGSLPKLPERGVYVFYEGGRPIYVGRSRNMRARILNHGRPSSMHNAATFAFILAKEEASNGGLAFSTAKRQSLQTDGGFSPLYLRAKDRVSRMQIRVVEVDNPIEQTVFEVYAAIALKTPYNDFRTH